MRIKTLSKVDAAIELANGKYDELISITDPNEQPVKGFSEFTGRKLHLCFDDVDRLHEIYEAPSLSDIQQLLDFARGSSGDILIHCAAGISRSTASTLLVWMSHLDAGQEQNAIEMMQESCYKSGIFPNGCYKSGIFPNRRIVYFGDKLLNCEGRLWKAYIDCYGQYYRNPANIENWLISTELELRNHVH